MSVRETLNDNRSLAIGGLALLMVVLVGVIIYQFVGYDRPEAPTQRYYTVDDGKTYFKDDAAKVPPFDHDGKPAVAVVLWSFDGGKTTFVAYLQRWSPEDHDIVQKAVETNDPSLTGPMNRIMVHGMQAKKPGNPESAWKYPIEARYPRPGQAPSVDPTNVIDPATGRSGGVQINP